MKYFVLYFLDLLFVILKSKIIKLIDYYIELDNPKKLKMF